jgi:hypothetical protein
MNRSSHQPFIMHLIIVISLLQTLVSLVFTVCNICWKDCIPVLLINIVSVDISTLVISLTDAIAREVENKVIIVLQNIVSYYTKRLMQRLVNMFVAIIVIILPLNKQQIIKLNKLKEN